jgi:hypothetical protein
VIPLWHPVRLLLVALAGWINQQQRDVIDYLQEENRVLREQLGSRDSGSPMTSGSASPRKRTSSVDTCWRSSGRS